MRLPALLASLVGIAAMCAALATPPAAAGGATPAPSFTGSCVLSGTETFNPPLALRGHPLRAEVSAAGRCTGTLVDHSGGVRRLVKATASYQQSTTGHGASCVGATAFGTGTLTVGDTTLPFTVDEPQLTVVSALRYVGQAWTGSGYATIAPTANPLSLALECAGGGIDTVPVDLSIRLRHT